MADARKAERYIDRIMRKELGPGIVFDMGGWPLVSLVVADKRGFVGSDEERKAIIAAMVEVLGKTIVSAASRDMRFDLQVDFEISVSEIFHETAPFILEFAMAMARPDIFEASKTSMSGSVIRFHHTGDTYMVEAVSNLIAHVPQGAPIRFEMA
jgi:hypothetical protein